MDPTVWLMGIVATVGGGVTIAWVIGTNRAVSDHGERLAALEATFTSVDSRTARIEEKLDRLGADGCTRLRTHIEALVR